MNPNYPKNLRRLLGNQLHLLQSEHCFICQRPISNPEDEPNEVHFVNCVPSPRWTHNSIGREVLTCTGCRECREVETDEKLRIKYEPHDVITIVSNGRKYFHIVGETPPRLREITNVN